MLIRMGERERVDDELGRSGRGVVTFWKLAYLCLMWCLWRKQNAQGIEVSETS
jgi:hypothetical protein